ncbi:hypothetical protein TTHERM_00639960 (macronuclear) [Tetrahymena thermophila SB210]|uniref:Uncharacterized protein n=1 Tax=Tetrahymena thermophila (strain SB210) TaxID=312017 RepID=Q23F36_TETTS|nr:hypothetical protein TTHERM_00639960 [Tetrahymena thermophila SB210]EAR95069.1 hypothetical protein TTHERM_00639960 [Tetrahymena thermophila SB210]|eukprot:XP_001015314.1 hypothetical protein TTHERM_00639960 [Tetrahymena thermophila SB210]
MKSSEQLNLLRELGIFEPQSHLILHQLQVNFLQSLLAQPILLQLEQGQV